MSLSTNPPPLGEGRVGARVLVLLLATSLFLGACASTPPVDAPPPAVDMPVAFREGEGAWVPVSAAQAQPLASGAWWELFGDPALDAMAQRVEVSNQNLAAQAAAYRQARATVAQQQAALFPQVTLTGAGNRSGGGDRAGTSNVSLNLGASWAPDLWGRLSEGLAAARATEQASAADLAAARLSLQGELASNYFSLRGLDAQRAVLRAIIQGLERSLEIAQNRYQAGVVARTDVLQAQTQLASARADLLSASQQRAQFEHAIAVLVGKAPGNFSIADAATTPATAAESGGPAPAPLFRIPELPPQLPSTLLLRRPDIVAAERRVVVANAQLGVARTAWFPSLNLTSSGGLGASALGELFSAGNLVWALGLSLAQTVFDGGVRSAQLEAARAGLDQAAAKYRQTVLSAFQGVEDQLSAVRLLREQQAQRETAARAAALVEQQVMNRYRAGQVGFTEVVTAQTTSQNARRALVQIQTARQLAAVGLVQALGGGWQR